jgi:hypothetical protein
VPEAASALDGALEALLRQPYPTQWLAHAHKLHALLIARRGEYDQARASEALRAARSLYELLGQSAVLRDLKGGRATHRQPTFVIRLDPNSQDPSTFRLEVRSPAFGAQPRRLVPAPSPLLFDILSVSTGEVFTEDFVERFLGDWRKVAAGLAEVLLTSADLAFFARRQMPEALRSDLRLEIYHPLLAPLPWEFLTRSDPPQRLLFLEPALRHCYRAIEETPSAPPGVRQPSILLLPSSGRDLSVLQRAYQDQGFKVHVVLTWTLVDLQDAYADLAPGVLHFCAPA